MRIEGAEDGERTELEDEKEDEKNNTQTRPSTTTRENRAILSNTTEERNVPEIHVDYMFMGDEEEGSSS